MRDALTARRAVAGDKRIFDSERTKAMSYCVNCGVELDGALEEVGCTLGEPATVTIGTAGGITAQALADGGVDVAFLPAEDLLTTEEDAAIGVLMNTDQDFFLASSTGREELDEHFRSLLEEALTTTEDGQAFLETCYPGVEFVRAVERPAES